MQFEINVSLNGKHMFATHRRSCTSRDQVRHLFGLFQVKFPEADGYRISVTQFDEAGRFIEDELDSEIRKLCSLIQ
jgi:hypothetical protein